MSVWAQSIFASKGGSHRVYSILRRSSLLNRERQTLQLHRAATRAIGMASNYGQWSHVSPLSTAPPRLHQRLLLARHGLKIAHAYASGHCFQNLEHN